MCGKEGECVCVGKRGVCVRERGECVCGKEGVCVCVGKRVCVWESVKNTSPTTENGFENCIYSMNNINMSNEDNNHDTNYINKHKEANHNTRKLHL